MATAAFSTLGPEQSTSTEATRLSAPTSMAWLETCTSLMWTGENGKFFPLVQIQETRSTAVRSLIQVEHECVSGAWMMSEVWAGGAFMLLALNDHRFACIIEGLHLKICDSSEGNPAVCCHIEAISIFILVMKHFAMI